MKDVSGVFDHFRIGICTLWNTAFWPDPDFQNWDTAEQFDEIQRLLFDELVLVKLDKDWPTADIFRKPIPFFRIVPSSPTTSILINNPRPGSPNGYWDHPVNCIGQGDAELHFLAYFDWNQMDYADLRYYLVKIANFDAHPELVGRQALIERMNATVHLIEV